MKKDYETIKINNKLTVYIDNDTISFQHFNFDEEIVFKKLTLKKVFDKIKPYLNNTIDKEK